MSSNTKDVLIETVQRRMREVIQAVDALQQAAADRLGLHRTDLRCLEIVARMGPMTAGELAEAGGLTSGSITALLDRLERAGLLERQPHAIDRRKVVVRLTPQAYGYTMQLHIPLLAEGRRFLDEGFDDRELEVIARYLAAGRDTALEHAQRMATMEPAPIPGRPAAHISPGDAGPPT